MTNIGHKNFFVSILMEATIKKMKKVKRKKRNSYKISTEIKSIVGISLEASQ